MGLFNRWFGSRDDVPEWAQFFSPESYRAFMAAVDSEMTDRGLVYEVKDGIVRVFRHGGEHADFGLVNLAQVCYGSDPKEWRNAITSHFENLLKHVEQSDELSRRAEDLDHVRNLIKVRLYPNDYLEQLGPENLIFKVLSDGLIEAIVFDLPNSLEGVPPVHLKKWKCSADEVFSIGLANVKAEGRLTPQTMEIGEKASLQVLIGEGFFVASHALFLEEYLEPSGPFGAVVSVPHRHTVLYHPIVDLQVALAINAMIPVTLGMYKEGPGSISPNLYWWRAGRFMHLPSSTVSFCCSSSVTNPPISPLETRERGICGFIHSVSSSGTLRHHTGPAIGSRRNAWPPFEVRHVLCTLFL